MDHQEQEALKFFADYIRQEIAARESGSESVSPPPPSPPFITNPERARLAVVAAMDDDHILNTGPVVFCNFPVEQLDVLRESRVNFNNMAANKMDLRQDVDFQGWGKFFERLNGPTYEKIVKEFWKHATCDDNYIVSHVLGKKVVITEKLIARLLELNHREGKVIAGKEKDMSDEERNVLNSYLYKGYKKDEFVYPLKSLRPPLRAWFRIIISCITPRPSGNSADYINIHQKYMLYCLCTDKKICLPYTIFQHLRECINSSRTAGKMKDKKRKIKYIPFGRLISDLMIQNGLIQDIIKTGLCWVTASVRFSARFYYRTQGLLSVNSNPRFNLKFGKQLKIFDFEFDFVRT